MKAEATGTVQHPAHRHQRSKVLKEYDLLVVGMGSGGLSAGLACHELGLRVCFFEKAAASIGGECLNTGCIPSKALIHVARQVHAGRSIERYGPTISGKLQWQKVKEHIHEAQAAIREHEDLEHFRKKGIHIVLGHARFAGRTTLVVKDELYTAPRIVLATGSLPVELEVPGVANVPCYDNRNIFDLEELPQRLLVIGGGPMGVELGQAFHRLGSEVTLLHRGERIMDKEDPLISRKILEHLRGEGLKIHLNAEMEAFPQPDLARFKAEGGNVPGQIAFDAVLVAIGRRHVTEGMDLEKAGIRTANGGLVVNDRLQTTNKQVYVCGDATGSHYFSHAAERQAPVLVNNLLSPFKKKLHYDTFSWVTFTAPEVATFGRTEEQLKEQGLRYERLEYDFSRDDRAITDEHRYGQLVLFITRPLLGMSARAQLLGGTMLAPHAGELIQELVLAMEQRLPLQALFDKTYAYPVASRVNKMLIVEQQMASIRPWMRKLLRWWYRI